MQSRYSDIKFNDNLQFSGYFVKRQFFNSTEVFSAIEFIIHDDTKLSNGQLHTVWTVNYVLFDLYSFLFWSIHTLLKHYVCPNVG